MTTLREAAQQALEALEKCSAQLTRLGYSANHADQVVPTVRAALEQPEQEPVDAEVALRFALEQPNADYERGFVDGMSEQAKRSVDRAVNRMADALEQPALKERNA